MAEAANVSAPAQPWRTLVDAQKRDRMRVRQDGEQRRHEDEATAADDRMDEAGEQRGGAISSNSVGADSRRPCQAASRATAQNKKRRLGRRSNCIVDAEAIVWFSACLLEPRVVRTCCSACVSRHSSDRTPSVHWEFPGPADSWIRLRSPTCRRPPP